MVCGTYESPLFGWKAHLDVDADADNIPPNKPDKEEEVQGGVVLEQLFAYSPHTGSIRVLAASGDWLVSSSVDEALKCVLTSSVLLLRPLNWLTTNLTMFYLSIRVYDMSTRRELGTITRSEGQITALEFFKSTHLFCGTERGDVLVWKTHHWEQMPSMKGHTGRVNSVSVHPSGVLALTVSQDKTLRLWDLEKGASVHTNKLEHEAEIVKWSPDGKHYIVTSDKRIVLYSSSGKKLRTLSEFKRVISVVWLDDQHFASGGEDRKLLIWNIHSDEPVRAYKNFGNRIKGIDIIPSNKTWPRIVTISSDERIRIFDPNLKSDLPVCSLYQDVRLICLAVAPIPVNEKKEQNKKRRDVIPDDEVESEAAVKKRSDPKKFKVIEYQDSKPIRQPGTHAQSKEAAPVKSILKKKSSPAPTIEEATKSVPKKEKLTLNTIDSAPKTKKSVQHAPQSPISSPSSKPSYRSKAERKKAMSALFSKK